MRHLTIAEFDEYTKNESNGSCEKTIVIKPDCTVTIWSNLKGAVMAGDWISEQTGYFLYLETDAEKSWFPSYFKTLKDALHVVDTFKKIVKL